MEEILFKSESVMSRSDVAAYLRTVADRLEAGGSMQFETGEERTTVDPPESLTFEVKVEREHEGAETELGVEFELEWDEDGADGDLSIS